MSWKNKKVLVTGSEGFIGSHLTERLLELGANIRSFVLYNSFGHCGWLDNLPKKQLDKLEIFMGDIRDASNVHRAMKDVDVVFSSCSTHWNSIFILFPRIICCYKCIGHTEYFTGSKKK